MHDTKRTANKQAYTRTGSVNSR